MVTVLAYLNDVEEGGGTDFPELEVTVELAKLEMALKKFESLREGDVIPLSKGDHARMYINGVPVFDADIGANGPQMAARIVKPLSPLK